LGFEILAADPEDAFPDCLGVESTKSRVANSSPATTAAPQDEQKRPASGTREPHDAQVDINFSA